MIIENMDIALTGFIVPGATLLAALLGASVAYWFHRRNEKRTLKREKAEELLNYLFELNSIIDLGNNSYSQSISDNYLNEEVNRLLLKIQTVVKAYFPEYVDGKSDINIIHKIHEAKIASKQYIDSKQLVPPMISLEEKESDLRITMNQNRRKECQKYTELRADSEKLITQLTKLIRKQI